MLEYMFYYVQYYTEDEINFEKNYHLYVEDKMLYVSIELCEYGYDVVCYKVST